MQKNYFIQSVLFFILLTLFSQFVSASEAQRPALPRPELKQIQDLRETSRLAKTSNLPVLMMFGTDECPYCEMLREEFLIPMIISGEYRSKIIMREVHIAYDETLIDFKGKKITASQFAHRYGVTLFPTMVFIDSKGKVLVEKILGITTPSLFGGTLDSRIDEALAVLRKRS